MRAQVEPTSEGTAYPIEAALAPSGSAWRATGTGEQSIRLLFDAPLSLRHICLVFDEAENTRTQELVRRVLPDKRWFYQDIVRQQYTFSPPSISREIEHFYVDSLLILRGQRR
jgi:hypothetical protein